MATSTINLYYDCKIVPERRIKVEQISSYLATLSKDTITRFQYVKHSLDLEIKISSDQIQLMNFQSVNFNYCSIVNNLPATPSSIDDIPHYYFILSKKWIAQDTIKLVLKLDTLNTFYDYLTFNGKTQILREHKPAHQKVVGGINPILDFNSEGLFPQLYCQHSSGYYQNTEIREDSANQNWYLVYRNVEYPDDNNTNSNPVECYLYTDGNLSIGGYSSGYSSREINWEQDSTDYDIGFIYQDNGSQTINLRFRDTRDQTLANVSYTLGTSYDFSGHCSLSGVDFSNAKFLGIRVKRPYAQEGYTPVPSWRPQITMALQVNGNVYDAEYKYVPAEDVYWPCVFSLIRATYGRRMDYHDFSDYIANNQIDIWPIVYWSSNYASFIIPSIVNVDRTDSRLIKIIKLPYCPDDTILRKHENLTQKWFLDRNYYAGTSYALVKLYDPTAKLEDTFTPLNSSNTPIKPFEFLKTATFTPAYWDNPNNYEEPKMFHSEFFCIKLVYDSFVLNLPAENLNVNGTNTIAIADDFKLKFVPSTTINSRFLWKVNNYITRFGSENFDNFLVVARNNELPIFTNAYLNYIRTGFNYDIKAKQTREAQVWAGVGLGIAGGVVSGAIAGGGYGAVAGAVVGAVSGLIGAITSTIQTENTFNKNLEALNWQTTSVRDSNDVDLMTEYCNNRLQVAYYIASQKVRQQVEKLFYYYGYKSERVGLPQPNKRIGWDFLQCQAEFNKNNYNISEEYISDIKLQLEAGTTFIHYIATENPDTHTHWDIDQEFANYEVAIM